MVAGGAKIVGAVAHVERGLGGNQDRVAASGDSLAEDFFGHALRINIGGVEEVDSGFEANVDQARGFLYVAIAPGVEEVAATAEGAGAEAEDGNF